MSDNHYELLGVARTATTAEIKKAYRKLIFIHHPDKNRDNIEQAVEITRCINNAWDVLEDPLTRAAYDRELSSKEAAARPATTTRSHPHYRTYTTASPDGTAHRQRAASETKPTTAKADDNTISFENESYFAELKKKVGNKFDSRTFTGVWPTIYSPRYHDTFKGVTICNCDITALLTSFCSRQRKDFISGLLKSLSSEGALKSGCYIKTESKETSVMIMIRSILNNVNITQFNWDKMPKDIARDKNQWLSIQKHIIDYRNKLTLKNTNWSLSSKVEIDRRLLELALNMPVPESATELVIRLKQSACSSCGWFFSARPACYTLAKHIKRDPLFKGKPATQKKPHSTCSPS